VRQHVPQAVGFQAQVNQDQLVGPMVDRDQGPTVKTANADRSPTSRTLRDNIGFADALEPAMKGLGWPIVQKRSSPWSPTRRSSQKAT